MQDDQIHGVQVGPAHACATGFVMLATGGIGGLFAHSTNPLGAIGSGLALAARAGADLRDMEFVQFHPTALACGLDPMPLISEAVRGEGAVLVDETGHRFMDGRRPRAARHRRPRRRARNMRKAIACFWTRGA